MSSRRIDPGLELRAERAIADLGLSFPLPLFDPDDPGCPRKIADTPANARRTRMRCWHRYLDERDLTLKPWATRLKPPGEVYPMDSVRQILDRFRLDEALEPALFTAVLEGKAVSMAEADGGMKKAVEGTGVVDNGSGVGGQ